MRRRRRLAVLLAVLLAVVRAAISSRRCRRCTLVAARPPRRRRRRLVSSRLVSSSARDLTGDALTGTPPRCVPATRVVTLRGRYIVWYHEMYFSGHKDDSTGVTGYGVFDRIPGSYQTVVLRTVQNYQDLDVSERSGARRAARGARGSHVVGPLLHRVPGFFFFFIFVLSTDGAFIATRRHRLERVGPQHCGVCVRSPAVRISRVPQ